MRALATGMATVVVCLLAACGRDSAHHEDWVIRSKVVYGIHIHCHPDFLFHTAYSYCIINIK